MFIITNKFTVWICTQCCFSGAAQSKEYRGITKLTHVGAAMHTQNIFLLWKNIIEDGENAFFDFTGISGASYQNHFVLERNDSGIVLPCAALTRVQL